MAVEGSLPPVRADVALAPYTTFRLGGPAAYFAEAATEEEIQAAALFAKEERLPLFVLGAGSNVLVDDEGLRALVVRVGVRGIAFEDRDEDVLLTAGAGESWDAVVDAAVKKGLFGIENLAGIPGSVGGAVVQNIGAYGAEVSSVFVHADVYDPKTDAFSRVTQEDAAFAYRDSVFKQRSGAIIVRAAFRLPRHGALSLTYGDLVRAQEAGVPLTSPLEVAFAVRSVRSGKFPHSAAEGTAGSFFKNPTLTAEESAALHARYPDLPQFVLADGHVKVPLAWILDKVLHLRGHKDGFVRAYEKQPLVVVAQAGATAHDVKMFTEKIAQQVFEATGVCIEREVEFFSTNKK